MRKKRSRIYEDAAQDVKLLSRYYPVDRENKLVTLHYDVENAGKLLDEAAAPGLRGTFKTDFFETCRNAMDQFPAPYRLQAEITAQEWAGHARPLRCGGPLTGGNPKPSHIGGRWPRMAG